MHSYSSTCSSVTSLSYAPFGPSPTAIVTLLHLSPAQTYRTWLVWRRDFRVVIFPTFTISGLLGT